ncbi:MAG: replicative DNA helicase [Planctomycetales bacterium]|nr:replicative DNA helicase [Planctomycetales bacterium]
MARTKRVDSPRRRKDDDSIHNILDRKPPCNIEAEMAVLGSILLRPDVCDEVVMILRPDDFYDEAHKILFTQMLKMHDAGKKIDVTLLVDEMKRSGDIDRIGGLSYLAEIGNSVATAAHAEHYAHIVRQDSTCRALINSSTEILKEAYESEDDATALLSRAEQRIFSILERGNSTAVHDMRSMLHSAMERIDARLKGEHLAGGVETGFVEFDNMTGGLHGSELVILAARPSMGKTALAMNIAENVVLRERQPVLFISLEMAAIELADRMLCSVAEVNGSRLRNGTISNEDRKRLVETAAEMSDAPLYVDDSPSRTVSEIAAAARRIKRREGNIGLIVIDYLQLIEPDNSSDPRQEQVAKMARRLKGMAREIDVPVLCLAQLNRQAEASKENRPRLSHLRESGAIEQDADVVMFVHREEYYRSGDEREQFAGQAEIIIAKQRNGPIGEVELVWRKEFTRFANPAPQHYDEFERFNADF